MKVTSSNDDLVKGFANDGYYIYAWICKDWGDVYFYIGKGKGDRYTSLRNRGMAFRSILSHWNCYPVILENNLTEEQAIQREDWWKSFCIFEMGFPIMDGEGNSAALKNLAIQRRKQELRKTIPGWKEGRKTKELPDFEKFLKMQKDGQLTVSECCKELGISRATWYDRVKKITD